MTTVKWEDINPDRVTSTRKNGGQGSKQQKLTQYVTMPEATEESGTMSIEQAQENADDYAGFDGASVSTLQRIERMSPHERHMWNHLAEEMGDARLATVGIHMDTDLPSEVLRTVRMPTEWEELDPNDITSVTCSVSGDELWQVEVPHAVEGDSHINYVDEFGSERGGEYIAGREGEYYDVDSDSDEFVSGDNLRNIEPDNTSSTSIAAFLPDEGVKIHVETQGTIRRDMSQTHDGVEPIADYPEIEAVVNGIILGDSDHEGLEGWVPLAARSEDGGSPRAMQDKVEEIIDTREEDFYIDSKVIACEINDGPASGKRYVAVPEGNAEEVDELLFDPDLY